MDSLGLKQPAGHGIATVAHSRPGHTKDKVRIFEPLFSAKSNGWKFAFRFADIESHGGSFSASSKNVYRVVFQILSVAAATEHD